tara:strand:- start:585 stop:1352 length:768 start_codon:yes stop_codon:yes gene_type:complete
MYFSNQIKLVKQIKLLKKNYKLYGLKAEFEAEGSSNSDIQLLRSISLITDTKIFVKIGGVEAINDIYNCLEIGVDGIIAPMVETEFGVHKFVNFFKKNQLIKKPHLTINIESKSAFDNLKDILRAGKGYIDNITIGRSDFSASYFNKSVKPDTKFIDDKITIISNEAKKNGITTTVGGSVSQKTIDRLKKNRRLSSKIVKLETRKIILPTKSFLKKDAIVNALNFEKNYILLKNEINKFKLESENNRLAMLNTRK